MVRKESPVSAFSSSYRRCLWTPAHNTYQLSERARAKSEPLYGHKRLESQTSKAEMGNLPVFPQRTWWRECTHGERCGWCLLPTSSSFCLSSHSPPSSPVFSFILLKDVVRKTFLNQRGNKWAKALTPWPSSSVQNRWPTSKQTKRIGTAGRCRVWTELKFKRRCKGTFIRSMSGDALLGLRLLVFRLELLVEGTVTQTSDFSAWLQAPPSKTARHGLISPQGLISGSPSRCRL